MVCTCDIKELFTEVVRGLSLIKFTGLFYPGDKLITRSSFRCVLVVYIYIYTHTPTLWKHTINQCASCVTLIKCCWFGFAPRLPFLVSFPRLWECIKTEIYARTHTHTLAVSLDFPDPCAPHSLRINYAGRFRFKCNKIIFDGGDTLHLTHFVYSLRPLGPLLRIKPRKCKLAFWDHQSKYVSVPCLYEEQQGNGGYTFL